MGRRIVIQIYAMTTPEDAEMVAALGADHVGLLAWTKPSLKPILSIQRARKIFGEVRGLVKTVVIPVSHKKEEIVEIASRIEPDYIQVASYPEYLDFNSFVELADSLHSIGIKVIRVIPVDGYDSLNLAMRYDRVSDVIMMDSAGGPPFPHVSGFIGGTGKLHDLTVSAEIRRRIRRPLILAGGLSPENVEEAIKKVLPWGVDAASSLNQPGRRHRKDPERVRRFIETIRNLERRL